MNKKQKMSVSDIVKGSAFMKVCAILRENDYTYTHDDGGYDNFAPEEIEIIKTSLMQESEKEREYAQDYINFYNALMQYSNFMSNSSANYEKELEKLSMYIDLYEMLQRMGKDLQAYASRGFLTISSPCPIPYCLEKHGIGGFILFNPDGTFDVDVDDDGNLLEVMYQQSAKTAQALAVLKAWIDVGLEIIGKDYDNPIRQLVPFNFVGYLVPPSQQYYPNKYYISDKDGRDSTNPNEKFAVIPEYKFITADPDGQKAASSILNVTLQQWQLSREKIAAIRKRLKKA